MTSDWTQQTALPLETSDVWRLMVSGFNRDEVMAAGNVCAATARAMMAEAAAYHSSPRLTTLSMARSEK